jgi:pilus assembly protein Flp/PilA
MVRLWNRFLQARSGATAVEYGLIVALIAFVIITGISAIGSNVSGTMTNIAANVSAK